MEEKTKNDSEFKFRLIAGSLFAISWLVLIGMKLSSDISLRIPLIISILFTVLFVISIFMRKFNDMAENLKSKEKIPEPLSNEKLKEMEDKTVRTEFWNYIEDGKPSMRNTIEINNNVISINAVNLYRQIDFGDEKTDKIYIIINATYPKRRPTILPYNTDKDIVAEAMNKMAKGYVNPNIEETEMSTDAFGKPIQKIKKVSYNHEHVSEESVV